jgi:hypothetical protein
MPPLRILLGDRFRPALPALSALPALMGRLPVMEPAIEANLEVGPALRAAFAATRGIAKVPHPAEPMAMTRHAPEP